MEIKLQNAEWLNFVEFNITGNNEYFNKCDPESKYMDEDLFFIFAPCFERSNESFDYSGPTRYNLRNIVPLQNELKKRHNEIEKLESIDDFKDFLMQFFMGNNFIIELEKTDREWKKEWEKYRDKLAETNMDLIRLIDKCIEEERVLWVVGY